MEAGGYNLNAVKC